MKRTLLFSGILLITILSLTSFFISGQNDKVFFATFKNNASGAYTIIHDDFGGAWANGIELYADTMAFNREIPFSFAAITGECDSSDWNKAKEMISHGHQILNHSMYHKCGQPVAWCKTKFWTEKDFPVEIDQSTDLIIKHTGVHPSFFIFPFDLFTDTMLTYLKQKKFAGARAGTQNITQSPDIINPFKLNFKVFRPESSFDDLNSFAEEAVKKQGWAIRVVHGVNDGSWASIPIKNYEHHLNYLKTLSEKKELWIANLSDVIAYSYLRKKYTPVVSKSDGKGRITTIDFKSSDEKGSDSFKQALRTSKVKKLTLIIHSEHEVKLITQKNNKVAFKAKDHQVITEIDPGQGAIQLTY